MIPAAKIWRKARMVHLVGRHANRMGFLGMFKVGSRHASCLDDAVVLGWVADVPPAGDCTAASLSLASLIKVGWAIQYRSRYVSPSLSDHFSLIQNHLGMGAFWRA